MERTRAPPILKSRTQKGPCGAQISNATGKGCNGRGSGVKSGIQKPAFEGKERMEVGVSDSHLGAKEPVQQPEIRALHGDRRSVGKVFVKHLVEVVAHFRFQHYVMAEADSEPAAKAREVGLRLAEPEIVHEASNGDVILGRCYGHDQQAAKQKEQRNTPHSGLLNRYSKCDSGERAGGHGSRRRRLLWTFRRAA